MVVVREDRSTNRPVRIAGLIILGAAGAALLGVLLARDQMVRHRRDLFSPHPLRRLAALGYIRSHVNVDNVLLLRDYLAWEQRPLLRRRAAVVLEGMEEQLSSPEAVEGL